MLDKTGEEESKQLKSMSQKGYIRIKIAEEIVIGTFLTVFVSCLS